MPLKKVKSTFFPSPIAGPSSPLSDTQVGREDDLVLNYWIRDITQCPWSIRIGRYKLVHQLGEIIKAEVHPRLKEVLADRINVWQVDIDISSDSDKKIKEKVEELSLEDDPLPSMRRLSDVFDGQPDESHLQLVLQISPEDNDQRPRLKQIRSFNADPIVPFRLPNADSYATIQSDHVDNNSINELGEDELEEDHPLFRFREHLRRKRRFQDSVYAPPFSLDLWTI
ncbi:hypothetical protein F5148DRAFT_102658 [Russula earlei]|uniref:Uncharacterized protein n=1 Tax=Russula earlei TaxID=71964 RepID=A0ACC0U9N9_9AGAM|nr:hypothetical protein F5148DRAFT_102658 [Russula earlei]